MQGKKQTDVVLEPRQKNAIPRKVGVEVVRSADLPSRFFKHRNAASSALHDDPWTGALRLAQRGG